MNRRIFLELIIFKILQNENTIKTLAKQVAEHTEKKDQKAKA